MRVRHQAAAQAIIHLLVIAVIANVIANVGVTFRPIVFQAGGTAFANTVILIALLYVVTKIVFVQQCAAKARILRNVMLFVRTGAKGSVNIVMARDLIIVLQSLT